MRARNAMFAATLASLVAAPALAQGGETLALTRSAASPGAAAEATDSTKDSPRAASLSIQPAAIRGLNSFEAPKPTGPFDGIKLSLGGAFAMTFQALDHSNAAAPKLGTDGVDANLLGDIRPGFNLPTANLNLGVELAPGIKMVLESYMSSRHHNEFWVKGGYATIDQSPIDLPVLNRLMQYTTVRAGMFEPNYGDAVFRRSDNGNTLNNPFVENYILDAFTTEPGADVLVRVGDFFALGGVTTGENKGNVKEGAVDARPALLAKVGFDRQVSEALRVRLSGSAYTVSETPGATLYAGDRTGSNYWGVIDNAAAASFTNGRINPGFRNEMTAVQINPFVKLGGLELFGVLERASGKAAAEAERRDVSQYAGDVVYRFLGDRLYVGGRYNVVKGDFDRQVDLTVDRTALAAGWFISPNLLTKVEYVRQGFDGFAPSDIRSGAEFSGFVIQGAIAF